MNFKEMLQEEEHDMLEQKRQASLLTKRLTGRRAPSQEGVVRLQRQKVKDMFRRWGCDSEVDKAMPAEK